MRTGEGRVPSCFETHRSAVRMWKHLCSRRAAMLLSMRAGAGGAFWRNDPALVLAKTNPTEFAWSARAKNQPAGVENERRGGPPVSGLFFTGGCAARACERLISFTLPPGVS